MENIQILMGLLSCAVCGTAEEKLKTVCTPETLEQVYTLAANHDLGHLVGQGASALGLEPAAIPEAARQAAMGALYRYMRLNHAYESVCAALEEAAIPFIPLKGSVLRNYYPEPWMRTSCDMDILVREEDLDRASQWLQDNLRYVYEGKTSHDVCLATPGGDYLELHYSMIEDYVSQSSKEILDTIWEQTVPMPGKTWHMCISDELFYFYHIAHMAKHFAHGGCGIRSFLDIWILNTRVPHDPLARSALLEKGELLAFARAAEKLSRIWFAGEQSDGKSAALESFVLTGGTYGTLENRVTLNQTKQGGKLRYALSRIFLPYEIMKHYYPILQKHKWLTPAYEVIRWCKLLFCGGVKRSVRELQVNAAVSQTEGLSAAQLLQYLGLEDPKKHEGETL